MNRVVRMVALSDLHARKKPDGSVVTTWARTDQVPPSDNPLETLETFVLETGLQADVLLCPGDLCDQADWSALSYAWGKVKRVAAALGDAEIVATVGNHDIDSRGIHAPRPIAQALKRPPLTTFPIKGPSRRAEFWASRVTAVRGELWQVVTLNSSVMGYLTQPDHDIGKIDDVALDAIRALIAGSSYEVNVLLCHHHPMRWTRLDRSDTSEMDNGSDLVQLLDDHESPWMLVHGHRHEPHLDYLSGGSESAVRLACGSVGARLSGRLASHCRNQMHLIEFPIDHARSLSLGLAGRVRSFSWRPVTGWSAAYEGDGLPAVGGFGFRQGAKSVARQLVEHARLNSRPDLERVDMVGIQPGLDYLLPSDLGKLRQELRTAFRCDLDQGMDGTLSRLKLPVTP